MLAQIFDLYREANAALSLLSTYALSSHVHTAAHHDPRFLDDLIIATEVCLHLDPPAELGQERATIALPSPRRRHRHFV